MLNHCDVHLIDCRNENDCRVNKGGGGNTTRKIHAILLTLRSQHRGRGYYSINKTTLVFRNFYL